MILGPLTFPTLAIRGCKPTHAWAYAAHPVIDGVERRQFVSRTADGYQLSLFLHAEFIDPKSTIDALKQLADDHEVLALQELSGEMLGNFVIESVDPTPIFKLADGFLVCATCEARLVDPGLEPTIIPPPPVAVVGTNAPTTTAAPPEDRSTPPENVSARQISRLP